MNQPYLEITYRRSKPIAAYLYLPKKTGDRAVSSEPIGDDLVIDRSAASRPGNLQRHVAFCGDSPGLSQ